MNVGQTRVEADRVEPMTEVLKMALKGPAYRRHALTIWKRWWRQAL